MILTSLDWIIILIYLLLSISISIYMSKRASRSMGDFFLTGRNLPWYIAGTSMVATTFAADTPLAVTELVAQNGIAGNWLWWNMVFGGILTVFFFARLWRRAGITTDCEFVAIRYSGRQANFLRGFRAVYIGIIMNMIVIAWVNLAMVKILKVMFPDLMFLGMTQMTLLGMTFTSHLMVVGCIMLFVAVYSSLSGLWGVSYTDSFQFILAMTGCIILAFFVLDTPQIGGISGLKHHLQPWVFHFVPVIGGTQGVVAGAGGVLKLTLTAFIVYIGVQWWASWYPGAEPGGGGYIAQRMMSAKNEKHSVLATLWFQIAHFAIRPWPWIIVALATLVLYPNEADKGAAYVMVIRDFLPPGLVGFLLAAFLAAYMSTIASQTVWGTSYIINDLFKPFIKPDAKDKFYVAMSRITTFILLFLSLIVTTQFSRISDAWKFILACSAGIGPVLILRWFWWRINAWSELTAMIAPYFVYPVLKYYHVSFEVSLLIIVAWSTVVWTTVTFLTKPASAEKLASFYMKVHPGGKGWKVVSDKMPEVKSDTGYHYLFMNWIAGCVMVLFFLFGVGKIIFGDYIYATIFLAVALICAWVIFRNMKRIGWEKVTS
jgi:Na+/proline symporter